MNIDIIKYAYRKFLNRDADPDGLETYSKEILPITRYSNGKDINDSIRSIIDVCEKLSSSEEFKNNKNNVLEIASEIDSKYIKNYFSYVIPIGTHCTLARILQKDGKKLFSLPFDWNFGHPKIIIDCLNDNFSTYLDRTHYETINGRENDEPGAHHMVYARNYGVGDFFAHRNPLENDLDYEYFMRCVDRFRLIVQSNKKKLFIMMSRKDVRADVEAFNIDSALSRKTSNYNLLIIQLEEHTGVPGLSSMIRKPISPTCDIYYFTPESTDEGSDNFRSIRDQISVLSVIKGYGLKLKPLPSE